MKKRIDYQLMSTDELWSLRQAIGSMLATKLETERHKLQNRLDELVQKLTPFSIAKRQRRAYPKVSEIPEPRATLADVGG